MLKSIGYVILVTAIICIPTFLTSTVNHEYTLQGSVIAIEDNIIVVEDLRGNIWGFEEDGFSIGDDVLMLMYDKATPNNIHDDVIKNIGKIQFIG